MGLHIIFKPIQLVSIRKNILWISVILLLLIPLLSFYPLKFRIIFTFFFILFAILDLRYPVLSTFFLAVSGIFFGNHPGGRFLELQDCLWIFWSIRGIVEAGKFGISAQLTEVWKNKLVVSLVFFFLIAILSLISNPGIFKDLQYYNKGLFWFLHSTELEPWYPFKLIFIGVLFLLGLVSRSYWINKETRLKPKAIYKSFSYGVAFGLVLSICIGLLENFSPFFRAYLDSYHFWLDGYKVISPHRPIFPLIDKILPTNTIQSTYWNRSWFSISIISSLPFLFYSFNSLINKKKGLLYFFSILTIGITLILIGARGAIVSYTAFLLVSLIHHIIQKYWRNHQLIQKLFKIFAIVLIFSAIIFPILIIWIDGTPQSKDRLVHFVSAFDLGLSKPILGAGYESYGWYNECCLSSQGKASIYHTSHNQFLQIFSGLGLAGIITYSFLWFFLLENIRGNFFKTDRKYSFGESAVYGSMIAIFIYGFFQEWFYLRAVYFQWIAMFVIFPKLNTKILIHENIKFKENVVFKLSAVALTVILFYSILFYSILFYTILP